ncbi:MAG: class I SAM-dependent methyltransferase [Dehalococcoidia bacterium]
MGDDGFFDERLAARYDEVHSAQSDPAVLDPIVDFLVETADAGPALEFAIGTGRVGLALSLRGVRVHGIELSRAMVDRLSAKPGAEQIAVTIGDMATTRVDGAFALVYLVANTIMNLTSQEAQAACFRNAAAHLRIGGSFVIEVIVPELQWLPPGERTRSVRFDDDHILIDEFDVANQLETSHHWILHEGQWERFSVPFRYVWPAELDLMAQLAGMRLRERWGNWNREPFGADSRKHISVWKKVEQ